MPGALGLPGTPGVGALLLIRFKAATADMPPFGAVDAADDTLLPLTCSDGALLRRDSVLFSSFAGWLFPANNLTAHEDKELEDLRE